MKFLALGLLVVIGGILGWQRLARQRLEVDRVVAREQAREVAHLRDENQRLAHAQVSAAELEALRSDHAVAMQLQGEIDQLKMRERAATEAATQTSAPAIADAGMIPASAWRNVGRATPEAAIQTAFWAASAGEVEMVAQSFSLDDAARARIENVLANLPENIRREYSTPERFVALMTMRLATPLVALQMLPSAGSSNANAELAEVDFRLKNNDGRTVNNNMSLRRYPDGYRIEFPLGLANEYLRVLTKE